MPHVKANGLELYYESHGPDDAEPILLIMGLGAQMTTWPPELIARLTDQGYRVIAFDNRDVGLSEKLDAAGAPDLAAIVASLREGHAPRVAYTLDDMADDAAGLLSALGVERAHIVGASMGGMIAQLVAANHPDRTLSLTSIMSTTGNPDLPRAKPEAIAFLNNRGPDPREDLEGFLDNAVASNKVMGSPAHPADPAVVRANARRTFERSFYPVGFQRHYAAITASPDRRAKLARVTAPTVVIHGEADPLVPVEGGHDTAAATPGAELVLIPGMGHDLPAGVHETVVAGILRAVERSKAEA
ncbi:alpha/beta fold hydrolase [Caulobacter sp. KR2-114]|uniref:alpha/beta fold hydrolase n=1 Tax=Caulobacter sp. KR2-114 TaxID=3400912 RepID=UPI003C0641B8